MTRRNAGIYTVKCTNEEGENQTTIKLDVQCKMLHTRTQNVVSSLSAYFSHEFVFYDHRNNPLTVIMAHLQMLLHLGGVLHAAAAAEFANKNFISEQITTMIAERVLLLHVSCNFLFFVILFLKHFKTC